MTILDKYIECFKGVQKDCVTSINKQLKRLAKGEKIDEGLYYYNCGKRDCINIIIQVLEEGGKKQNV